MRGRCWCSLTGGNGGEGEWPASPIEPHAFHLPANRDWQRVVLQTERAKKWERVRAVCPRQNDRKRSGRKIAAVACRTSVRRRVDVCLGEDGVGRTACRRLLKGTPRGSMRGAWTIGCFVRRPANRTGETACERVQSIRTSGSCGSVARSTKRGERSSRSVRRFRRWQI